MMANYEKEKEKKMGRIPKKRRTEPEPEYSSDESTPKVSTTSTPHEGEFNTVMSVSYMANTSKRKRLPESDRPISTLMRSRRVKPRTSFKTTELVGEITDWKGKIVPIRILLDSGTSSTIILRKFVSEKLSQNLRRNFPD